MPKNVLQIGVPYIVGTALLLMSLAPAASAWQTRGIGSGATKLHRYYSRGERGRSHTGVIKNVRLLAGGTQAVSCGSDGVACLWDLEAQKIIRRFSDGVSKELYCLALVADEQQLLIGGNGGQISLWSLSSGEKLKVYDESSTTFAIDVLPDGNSFLAGDRQGNIRHWNLQSEKVIATYRQDSEDITALRVLGDGSGFFAGNGDGWVARWQFGNSKPEATYEGMESWVCCLQISDDGSQLAGSDYRGATALWDIASGDQIWRREEVSGEIYWVDFVDNETLVGVDGDNQLIRFDRKTGKYTKQRIDMPSMGGFALAADRSSIYCGGKNIVCQWRLADAQRLFPDDQVYQQSAAIRDVMLIGDQLVSINDRWMLESRDVRADQRQYQIDISKSLGEAVSDGACRLHLIGDQIVASTPSGYLVLERDSGKVRHRVKHDYYFVNFCPETRMVVAIDDDSYHVIETDLGGDKRRNLFSDHEDGFNELHVLNQRFVVAVPDSYPRKIEIRSRATGELVQKSQFEASRLDQFDSFGKTFLGVANHRELLLFATPETEGATIVPQDFNRLIDDLGAESFAARQAAMLKLADGGQTTLQLLQSITPSNTEVRFRIRKIRELIERRRIPVLTPLETDSQIRSNIETVAIDPHQRRFLLTIRRGWQSELLVGAFNDTKYEIVRQFELESKASRIRFGDVPGRVAVGYVDGTIDVFEIAD